MNVTKTKQIGHRHSVTLRTVRLHLQFGCNTSPKKGLLFFVDSVADMRMSALSMTETVLYRSCWSGNWAWVLYAVTWTRTQLNWADLTLAILSYDTELCLADFVATLRPLYFWWTMMDYYYLWLPLIATSNPSGCIPIHNTTLTRQTGTRSPRYLLISKHSYSQKYKAPSNTHEH